MITTNNTMTNQTLAFDGWKNAEHKAIRIHSLPSMA